MNLSRNAIKAGIATVGMACFLLLAAQGASAQGTADQPGSGTVVKPIKAPPLNAWFQELIVKRGLEKLGYKVEKHAEADFPALHLAIANGDADYTASHWTPLHTAYFTKAGGDSAITRLGTLISGAKQGYLIDKRTADKYQITSIDQLKDPKLAKLFDTDGDGKANLAGCDPGWGCERVIEHHLDAYKLRGAINHDQGKYFAIIANTITRFKNGDPVFYYMWTPMWLGNVIVPGRDSVWLDVPFSAAPDDASANTKVDGHDTGFAVNDIRVLANNKFLAKNPAAKRLFELAKVSLADINEENLKQYKGENKVDDAQRHADEWIKKNQSQFDGWIAEAKRAAK